MQPKQLPLVNIHLKTTQSQDGTTTEISGDYVGQFFQMGDSLYLRYSESDKDEPAMVTFKLQKNGKINLSRTKKDTSLRLFFGDQQRIEATYRMPYGIIPIETSTPYLSVDLQNAPTRGAIALDYDLFSRGEQLGSYKIRLWFEQE